MWVDANGLTLHPDKTHIGGCRIDGQGFEFLGYRFEAGKRWVSNKSLQGFKDKIREKTRRTRGGGRCRADHQRWPNAYFAALGLFTMTEARRLASQSG